MQMQFAVRCQHDQSVIARSSRVVIGLTDADAYTFDPLRSPLRWRFVSQSNSSAPLSNASGM